MGNEIHENIQKSLIAWLKSNSLTELISALPQEKIEQIYNSLRFSHSQAEKFIRLVMANQLMKLDQPHYHFITDTLKKIRGQKKNYDNISFSPGPFMKLVAEACEILQFTSPKAIFCLTHDIDNPPENAEYWPEVPKIEELFGFRSTFNVLTEGSYKLEHGWLDELEDRGFEIGLHGDTHDMAFGFRNQEEIAFRIDRCIDKLDRKITGFRAPALGISETLLLILSQKGFRYDSSITVNMYHSCGVDVCIPYKYPGIDIWEFPLTIQDSGLFKDRQVADDKAISIIQELWQLLSVLGGVMVFNSHPIHIKAHKRFYQDFLEWLAKEDIETVLAKDIAKSLDRYI